MHLATAPLLAQNSAAAGRVFFWCAVLLVAAGLLVLVAWIIRGRLMAQDDDGEPLPMGFSLSDLRQLHARGELTDEEFEHAKRRMVAGTRADLAAGDEAGSGGTAAQEGEGRASGEDDGMIRWEDPPDTAPPPEDFGPDSDADPSR